MSERLYQNAVSVVRETGFASVSLIQRRLALGYTQASLLIDRMEQEGVIGPSVRGTVKRELLEDTEDQAMSVQGNTITDGSSFFRSHIQVAKTVRAGLPILIAEQACDCIDRLTARVAELEASPPPISPTHPFVMRMARYMEQKLAENRYKGNAEGWRRDDPSDLQDRVSEENDELWDAVREGKPPEEVWREAADVANMAMMVADAYEHQRALSARTQTEKEAAK